MASMFARQGAERLIVRSFPSVGKVRCELRTPVTKQQVDSGTTILHTEAPSTRVDA